MESIYYVLTYLCHRECAHCYEERFRPYHGAQRDAVAAQSAAMVPRVIANLPERLTYRDGSSELPSSVILAGGEVLLDAVRESALYPALRLLRDKYAPQGGVKAIVQTTGDALTPRILEELLALGVWMVSVSGIDPFHQGLETEASGRRLAEKLTRWFESAGMHPHDGAGEAARTGGTGARYYQLFGATPDRWIGKLWPRGRAWKNALSTATLEDNFCAQWSGGIRFLEAGAKGSEVSIEPDGSVYPCCLKTRLPVGNVAEEPLLEILARLRGNPVYEAINRGEPQRMGLEAGWSEAEFRRQSRVLLPSGKVYENLCLGCDRFHEKVLIPRQSIRPASSC